MASTHHWALSMSLKISNIVSQIHSKKVDNKKIFIFHLGGSEYYFSDSDTPTEGSSDNESYTIARQGYLIVYWLKVGKQCAYWLLATGYTYNLADCGFGQGHLFFFLENCFAFVICEKLSLQAECIFF